MRCKCMSRQAGLLLFRTPVAPLRRTVRRDFGNYVPHVAIDVAERFFDGVHLYTHLPWWAVIACCTVALRSLITLPLAVHQHKMLAKMELLTPTLKEYQEAVQHNVIIKCKRENVPYEIANKRVQKECIKVARQLYRQEGCNPYKVAILPWVQIPLWIVASSAMRDMSGIFPNKTPVNPEVTVSLANEGILWFSNLTLPDPYYVLPVMLALTNLVNIQLHAIRRQMPTRRQRIMTNMFRVLSIWMGVVASQVPAAMSFYWYVSSSFGLTQNVLFKLPRVRRTLAIPKTPSESKHPYKDLLALIKEKSKAFIKLQRK